LKGFGQALEGLKSASMEFIGLSRHFWSGFCFCKDENDLLAAVCEGGRWRDARTDVATERGEFAVNAMTFDKEKVVVGEGANPMVAFPERGLSSRLSLPGVKNLANQRCAHAVQPERFGNHARRGWIWMMRERPVFVFARMVAVAALSGTASSSAN
jgi:hypothetical protein